MKELLLDQRYRMAEIIGSGGMADVYKATDEVLGRIVAVKIMHAHLAAEASFAARFRQEAQAAASLTNPNIVHMYDWGFDAGTYYIVMEYVRGNDLKSIIELRGALSSHMVAEIGAQVCCALSDAHGHDIIHRDIKPHNIMVQPDGAVKVMDFGIARTGTSTMTRTGSVLGTAHYMSPEQAQGKQLTAASDLYSLGIVLYESAAGTLPFDADTAVAVALKQMHQQAVPLHVINPDVDSDLDRVIAVAMRKNPEERYASADDLRSDLLQIAQRANQSPAAALSLDMADEATDRTPSSAKTEVLRVQAPTAVMPIVHASALGGSEDLRRQRTVARRRRVWPWVLAAVLLAATGFLVARTAGTGRLGVAAPDASPVARPAVKSEPTQIPSVLGMVEADAVAAIESAGFSAQAGAREFNQEAPAGTVYTQSPLGDSTATAGSVVRYVISEGPQPESPGQSGKKGKSKSSHSP